MSGAYFARQPKCRSSNNSSGVRSLSCWRTVIALLLWEKVLEEAQDSAQFRVHRAHRAVLTTVQSPLPRLECVARQRLDGFLHGAGPDVAGLIGHRVLRFHTLAHLAQEIIDPGPEVHIVRVDVPLARTPVNRPRGLQYLKVLTGQMRDVLLWYAQEHHVPVFGYRELHAGWRAVQMSVPVKRYFFLFSYWHFTTSLLRRKPRRSEPSQRHQAVAHEPSCCPPRRCPCVHCWSKSGHRAAWRCG